MARIDFYLLEDASPDAYLRTACRLTEKAYLAKHQVYLAVDSPTMRQQLDDLLWTFRDISFVPHCHYGKILSPQPPVQIGYDQTPQDQTDIIINLTSSLLPFYAQFQRVIEIVPNEEAKKQHSRSLYKQYQEAGCEINTHQLK